ncbi:MAG: bifunctional phosphopantothenoylcysteine decarboxylase/phosphopantothenate--cysteine ligase CoaBC [candidate division Zixibacteria bacterium]|nr:bifunctional phosphopantothenoylcysteine decarboxylase/phosphopantothenate--cysteine ligase CoaBC [candidate division Zixibacteria bacterium]
MPLKGKKILLGLTGGIACYKIPYLIRFLLKHEAEVRVVMSRAATEFITPLTLETVSGSPVMVEMFDPNSFVGTRHIDLAQWPDLVVVAPTTANFLGKVASGICDDLLTTIICATPQQILIAPAMNHNMWANPITARNFKTLTELGYLAVGPEEGEMACDQSGVGRMAEPETIFAAVESFFKPSAKKKALEGKRIVITAGPTQEAIDPVRFISNYSSGKMGYALARQAQSLGAVVTLISGPTALAAPFGVKLVAVQSTADLQKVVGESFPECDCLIMAAAPADYRPVRVHSSKMKRQAGGQNLELVPTDDILSSVTGSKREEQVVVGFALETDNGVANARKKLKEKRLDLIVLNQPGPDSGFISDTNRVSVIGPGRKPISWPLAPKEEIALKLLELIGKML